jgi:MoaA/NifB/PqqE/SkfB family radical SAM enzyme
MISAASITTATLVRMGELTNRTLVLPLVIFFPTSRCNSRCISCDWWAHGGEDDLALEEIKPLAKTLSSMGTRLVVFSGGEPLLRTDVFEAAAAFRKQGIALHLLTSGVLLERRAESVAQAFERVTISLDAASDDLYARIRGIAALRAVERGVARLRRLAPRLPVTARATVHRANHRELPRLIEHAKALRLDGISFLAADLSPTTFGRTQAPTTDVLVLQREEVAALAECVERVIVDHRADFESGFIAESPEKLRRLPRYYAALAGDGEFPAVSCNAPWVSVVIEADGGVRPCFFHRTIGNIRERTLSAIVKDDLGAFRRSLDVAADPVCQRCVCSLKVSWRSAPWAH